MVLDVEEGVSKCIVDQNSEEVVEAEFFVKKKQLWGCIDEL